MCAAATLSLVLEHAAGLALLAAAFAVSAQPGINVALTGVPAAAALEALAKECYDAGMVAQMPSDSIMDCAAVLDERSAGPAPPADATDDGDDVVVVRHRLRFTALERGAELTIAADAWTETQELGIAIEEPIVSQEYLERIRAVLLDVGRRLRESAGAAPAWAGRYESEQAWHLDAHLRAVRHCDANFASMRAEALGEQLRSIGVRPLSERTRDRCEQLHQHLLEWGLARGNTAPTVEEYARYREALPAAQRACSGRLALDAACD